MNEGSRHWSAGDLTILRGLRARFLEGSAGEEDYWKTERELELYDRTFGARIGWKIDAALRAAKQVGWRTRGTRVLDWGCGSGVAGRCVLEAWPGFEKLALHDRSVRAIHHAEQAARRAFPNVAVERSEEVDATTVAVLSHVISELDAAALAALLERLRAAAAIVWIEAGTHADSRRLIAVRETLRSEFGVIAPCTHRAGCGMLAAENARHWCHHFARPPAAVFQDAAWEEWRRELGIDLRSLPFSYLIMEKNLSPQPALEGASRIIGRPRESKGYCRILSCQASGVGEWMLQKRDDAALFKKVLRESEPPPFLWRKGAGRIVGGEPIGSAPASFPISESGKSPMDGAV